MQNPALQVVKEDSRLPDHYGITVVYHDKTEDDFKAVSHVVKNDLVEIYTKEALFTVIPLNAIRKFSFDKSFTKIQELQAEKAKKEQK